MTNHRRYTAIVTCCAHCPHLRHHYGERCGNAVHNPKVGTLVNPLGPIPDWCPLPKPAVAVSDPVLAWLEHEAALARHVLEAEQDLGNIEIMRQWVYVHECLVRQRQDELGLLDDDLLQIRGRKSEKASMEEEGGERR
jgi:hypothetical protein